MILLRKENSITFELYSSKQTTADGTDIPREQFNFIYLLTPIVHDLSMKKLKKERSKKK